MSSIEERLPKRSKAHCVIYTCFLQNPATNLAAITPRMGNFSKYRTIQATKLASFVVGNYSWGYQSITAHPLQCPMGKGIKCTIEITNLRSMCCHCWMHHHGDEGVSGGRTCLGCSRPKYKGKGSIPTGC